MAYKVTVYFNDEDIASTNIYGYKTDDPMGWVDSDYSYGQSAMIANFANTVKFKATPASGCEFTRWVYRIGGDSGDQKYSYANPFSYSGTDEIIIRAEGQKTSGGDDTEELWSLVPDTLGLVTGQTSVTIVLQSYVVYMFSVEFENDGIAKFYTTGNVNTYGQLSEFSNFDTNDGVADNDCAEDTDSGEDDNFYFEFDVVSGTTYYVFASGNSETDTGTTVLHIIPPVSYQNTIQEWSWDASNGSANATETAKARTAVRNKGYTKNFSYKVWNDMVDKVKELTDNSINYWDTSYASYANTKMTSSGEKLTAKMFNSLRNNLELVGLDVGLSIISNAEIPHPVSSGDTVYGHYFTTLTDYMNDCIDNL